MHCESCGQELGAGGAFCGGCGAALATSPAGFWKRFVALLIDGVILYVPLGLLQLFVAAMDPWLGVLFYIPYLIMAWLYFALQESSSYQATLGKRAMGIRVTDLDGQRIGLGRASGRHVAAVLNYVTIYIGYALAGWTQRKQGLHDLVASTLVMNRPGSGPMPGWAVGLLVVVVLLVPVGGVLAAIAIPAYQDYTLRAKVVEGMQLAAPMRLAYSETLVATERLPMTAAEAGTQPGSNAVATVDIVDGLVVVTYAAGQGKIGGETLALEPLLGEDGSVHWICGNQDYPPERIAKPIVEASAADYTSIEARHLPARCR